MIQSPVQIPNSLPILLQQFHPEGCLIKVAQVVLKVNLLSVKDIFDGKKIVLFAVPGAYTPTCHSNHLPGYLENRDAILAKGVDDIAVVSVNDAFVMGAWAQSTGGEGKLRYLSDDYADFIRVV